MFSKEKLHKIFKNHLYLFTSSQINLLEKLIKNDFGGFIEEWQINQQDEKKKKLLEQLENFDKKYKNGILNYFLKAKEKLTEKDSLAFNKHKITKIDSIQLNNDWTFQEKGIEYLNQMAIVLVAGGIGERLGLQINKLLIPFDPYLKKHYLFYYCQAILALQKIYFEKYHQQIKIPFIIVVNKKGFIQIREEFERNNFYHLLEEQIYLKEQLEVPCFNCDGEIFIDDFTLPLKPHGHGNVHEVLLQKEKNGISLAKELLNKEKKYLFFFARY